jgi:hypothetical protein
MDFLSAIHDGLLNINHDALPYLLDLCVISALAMAILQAAKEISTVREDYNRRHFLTWLDRRSSLVKPAPRRPDEYLNKAEGELLRIATDRDQFAFYGGDAATMCAQFSGAASVLLDYPELSPQLFHLLTVNSEERDVEMLMRAKPLPPMPVLPNQALTYAELKQAALERQALIDARNRIRHQLSQSISSFQSTVSARWERTMKFWAWFLSLLLTFLAGSLAGFLTGRDTASHVVILFIASAISGFLAPIARDLVAALEGLHP